MPWVLRRLRGLLLAMLAGAPAADSYACRCPFDSIREGTDRDDQILDAAAVDAGGFVLVGYENGMLGAADWPIGDTTAFVEFRNADGSLRWRRTIETGGIDLAETVTPAAGGTIWVAGRTSGALAGYVNRGLMDGFVAAYDQEGRNLQLVQYGDERPQHPTSILARGTCVIAVGFDDIYIPGSAVEDWENGTVTRFSTADGTLRHVSHWRSSAPNDDRFVDAAESVDGRLFLVAYHFASASRGGGTHLIEWSPADVELDRHTISSHAQDFPTQVLLDEDKIVVVGAAVSGVGGVGRGYSQGFAAAIDPRGLEPLWTAQLPSDHATWVRGAYLRDGEVTLAGVVAIEDRQTREFSTYLLGGSFDAQGVVFDWWQTSETAMVAFEPAALLPPACGSSPIFAGAITGDWAGTPGHGGTDRLLLALRSTSGFCDGFEPISMPRLPGLAFCGSCTPVEGSTLATRTSLRMRARD